MDSEVEVAGHKLSIRKLIAEGGTAYVYVAQDHQTQIEYALKRLIGADKQACNAIINEINIHKQLSGHANILQFIGAAFIDKTTQPQQHAEYHLLTEYCRGGNLVEYARIDLEPRVVLRIFYQASCAVAHMHNQMPPAIHRDIKIENFLIGNDKQLKLCDFGSATKETFAPNYEWSVQQRNALEDQLCVVTTPMYRAPEMLDTWSNYEINAKVDIWALGCILYELCFKKHPFEDSAKLRIINGNYIIPSDSRFECFHDIIKGCLVVDPQFRFNINMILDRLAAIGETKDWPLKGPLELKSKHTSHAVNNDEYPNSRQRANNATITSLLDSNQQNPSPSQTQLPHSHTHTQHQQPATSTAKMSSTSNMSLFSSLRDGAGNFLKNLKDTSSKVMQTVQQSIARADLDVSYITSRVLVMPIPSEGFESAYKTNSIEDVRIYVESRFTLQKVSVYNFGARSSPRLPPPVRTVEVGIMNLQSHASSLQRLTSVTEDMYGFLNADTKSVIILQTNDSCVAATFVCALLMYAQLICEPEDAVQVYAVKRHPINLRPSEFRYLYYFGDILRATPLLPHSRSLNLISLSCSPVPRMTKSRDGCRLYIEVYANDHLLLTTLDDYEKMMLYHVVSSKIVIPLNTMVYGDLTVILYHARSGLKGLQAVKICQFQLYTGFIPEQETLLSFGLNDLDDIPEGDLLARDFKVSLSISVADTECTDKQDWLAMVKKPTRNTFSLFSSQLEMEEMIDNFVTKPSSKIKLMSAANTKSTTPPMTADITTNHNSKVDFIMPDVTEIGHESAQFNIHEPSPPIDLLNLNQQCDASFDLLGAFGDDVSAGIGTTAIPDILDNPPTCETMKLDDIFGSLASSTTITLGQPIELSNQHEHTPSSQSGAFDNSKADNTSSDNLFGNIANLASKLNINVNHPMDSMQINNNNNNHSSSGATTVNSNRQMNFPINKQTNPQPPPQAQPAPTAPHPATTAPTQATNAQSMPTTRPDYNRSHFETQKNPMPSAKNSDIFADILGEQGYKFGQKSNQGSRSINEMRKEDLIKDMDPERVKIMEWTEGKKNNIRALLCSMDMVLWKDVKWNKCEMSALITRSDVKKAYRRACLAVHPDKHTGSENEHVAKLVFMELNNAWSEFEKDATQL